MVLRYDIVLSRINVSNDFYKDVFECVLIVFAASNLQWYRPIIYIFDHSELLCDISQSN